MARVTVVVAALAAIALASAQSASTSKQCLFPDICYSLNLPTNTFTNGGGDLYFQISAPDTYSWAALGQGSGMKGANIFVIYANGMGNVTLSPRLGVGHVQPKYNPDAEVELLAGSGILDGRMIANVKCGSCSTWDGGSMELKSDIAMWIGAALEGPALDSTDPEEDIDQHTLNKAFPWAMSEARGGPDTNPFVMQQRGPQRGPPPGYDTRMGTVHGSMASLAFLVIFPAGAIFIRHAKFKGLVWVHAAIQLTGYAVFVCAAGLGLHMMMTYPKKYGRWDLYTDPHPKIGMALLAYLFFQPISGFINHWLFGKKGKRLFSQHIHIWAGRAAILLGFINGGLGQKLGHVMSTGYRVAYGIVATVMGLLFVANIVFAQAQRHGPNPSLLHRGVKLEQASASDRQGHVRMESMEDRSRLHGDRGD